MRLPVVARPLQFSRRTVRSGPIVLRPVGEEARGSTEDALQVEAFGVLVRA
jgi:hypothetical protein